MLASEEVYDRHDASFDAKSGGRLCHERTPLGTPDFIRLQDDCRCPVPDLRPGETL